MNYYTYPNKMIVAIKAAERIQELSQQSDKTFHMALSGGLDIIDLYKVLTKDPFKSSIEWSRFKFYFVYERMATDQTNFQLAQKYLFDPLQIADDQIIKIDAMAESHEAEAERYTALLRQHAPMLDGNPRFDLTILEIGNEGQTAGVFAHQYDLLVGDEMCVANNHPSAPGSYVTLTLPALEESRKIIFYCTNDERRFAIGHIINLLPEGRDYPMNILASKCPWMDLYADEDTMREKSYAIY